MVGWLDLVVARVDCTRTNMTIDLQSVSDHGLTNYQLPFLRDAPIITWRTVRYWPRLDRDEIRRRLHVSRLCDSTSDSEDVSVVELMEVLLPSLMICCRQKESTLGIAD